MYFQISKLANKYVCLIFQIVLPEILKKLWNQALLTKIWVDKKKNWEGRKNSDIFVQCNTVVENKVFYYLGSWLCRTQIKRNEGILITFNDPYFCRHHFFSGILVLPPAIPIVRARLVSSWDFIPTMKRIRIIFNRLPN